MRRVSEEVLFGLFLLVLLWAPVPLGSVAAWAWGGLAIAIYALVLGWLLLWAASGTTPPTALVGARWALLVLGLWCAEQALQAIALPRSVVELLSPEAARIHALVDGLGIKSDTATLSVDPYASRASLLRTLAYAGAFFLTLALANSRRRIRILAGVLVFSAVVHSCYAVLMHLIGGDQFIFDARIPHGAQASGFYVNRNHFAGYLEMTLALGIGLLIAGLSDRRAETWKQFARQTLEWILSPKMVLRLSLCVMVIALTTTHSRMGNTAFFSSLLIAGVIGIVLSRHATRNTVILLASLVIIDLAIVGSWFGVERLVQRIEQTTTEELVGRETPAAYTLGMLERSPVFGLGPGTFYVSFEPYRPESVVDYYDYTHNDYAQFAAESGLLGMALIGGFVLLTLLAALRAQWARRDPLMRGMSFACIMGVAAILIHSSADFNLQIPANATYFMVLLALGWISLRHDEHRREKISERTATPWLRWVGIGVAASVLGWASLHASRAVRTDDALYRALQSLRVWAVPGQFDMISWTQLRERLERAQAIAPDNPEIEEFLGLLDARRFDEPARLNEASAHYVRALAMRPISANTWANLAEARYQVGDTGVVFRRGLENAARLAPSNPQVQRVATLYGLAVFDEVGPGTRKAIESMVGAGMRRDPGEMLAIAQRRGRLDVACPYLVLTKRTVDPRWRQACAGRLK